ncbi:hypothetical protein HAX54_045350, partial [Datura stramonium]|nr:hypothetical protein [Datura stramonium]
MEMYPCSNGNVLQAKVDRARNFQGILFFFEKNGNIVFISIKEMLEPYLQFRKYIAAPVSDIPCISLSPYSPPYTRWDRFPPLRLASPAACIALAFHSFKCRLSGQSYSKRSATTDQSLYS